MSLRFASRLAAAAKPRAISLNAREFHQSLPATMPRKKREEPITLDNAMDALDLDFKEDDTTSLGHNVLRQHRQTLYYLRLIEHEMPRLVAHRKPFIPPSTSAPLIIRSVDYAGEEHPAAVKRTIVVPVVKLPLTSEDAFHKIKLLAGPRWTPDPPTDAGVGPNETGREHGFIKIACEDFPKPAMNLKWASDALDRLVEEANNTKDTFRDIPVDTRHVDAKARKAKKGEHLRNRIGARPSIRDFPKEWLPAPKEPSITASTL